MLFHDVHDLLAAPVAHGDVQEHPVVVGGLVLQLAQGVEQSLRQRVPMSGRAIQQAPFRVLVGANMPAVLVERGFITNADQEKQLRSDQFQESLVQAFVEAITRYRDARASRPADGAGAAR